MRTRSKRCGCSLLLTIFGLAAVVFGGCAQYRIVEIKSNPLEASIYVNGVKSGQTPATVRLDFTGEPNYRVLVQIIKPGYIPVDQPYKYVEVPESRTFELESE